MTQLTDPTDVSPIHPEMEADITKFEEMLADYQAGRIPEDVFRVFRLNNGIYGQRQGGTSQMVRVKVPYGAMTADQLDLLADVVDDHSRGMGPHHHPPEHPVPLRGAGRDPHGHAQDGRGGSDHP
jgi:Sulfite reductase, beta subunit (hemoprotein)